VARANTKFSTYGTSRVPGLALEAPLIGAAQRVRSSPAWCFRRLPGQRLRGGARRLGALPAAGLGGRDPLVGRGGGLDSVRSARGPDVRTPAPLPDPLRLPPNPVPSAARARSFGRSPRIDLAPVLDAETLLGFAPHFVPPLASRFASRFASPLASPFTPPLAPAGFAAVRAEAGRVGFAGAFAGEDRLLAVEPGFLAGAAARLAASFLGTNTSLLGAGGAGRQITSSLPIICTDAQPSALHSSFMIRARTSRSSPRTLILINSCEFNARSASATTASVRPESPIMTTGSRWCASARSARRCAEVMTSAARAIVSSGTEGCAAAGRVRDGEVERGAFIGDPAIMTARILLAP